MITEAAGELACASVTTSEKTSVAAGEPAGTAGALKLGWAVSAPARVTAAPDDCVQAKVIASPSGSKLPRPSRVTEAADATDWSGPALATGAGFGGAAGFTVMFTSDGAELRLASLTVSEKLTTTGGEVKSTVGAVKPGLDTVALESATIGPAVCVQAKVSGSPAGSLLALPSRVTGAPESTAWSGPAFAIGAGMIALTVMVTLSGAEAPFASLTTKEKTSEAAGDPNATAGALKLGLAVLAFASVTGRPEACVHWK